MAAVAAELIQDRPHHQLIQDRCQLIHEGSEILTSVLQGSWADRFITISGYWNPTASSVLQGVLADRLIRSQLVLELVVALSSWARRLARCGMARPKTKSTHTRVLEKRVARLKQQLSLLRSEGRKMRKKISYRDELIQSLRRQAEWDLRDILDAKKEIKNLKDFIVLLKDKDMDAKNKDKDAKSKGTDRKSKGKDVKNSKTTDGKGSKSKRWAKEDGM